MHDRNATETGSTKLTLAAVRGILAGATHALITWVLDQLL